MKRAIWFGTAVLALGLVLSGPAEALAFIQQTGDTITVSEFIRDDLYLTGGTIEVSGDVDGDVVAFGQSIRISGNVSGDVISAGQTVAVSGTVGGSVRAAGQEVSVDGTVAQDVLAAGQNVRISPSGSVGRDAVAGAASVLISGEVKRNVLVGAQSLTISAPVGGGVTAEVEQLTVTSSGSVAGDVTYYSASEATIQGDVNGTTERLAPRTRTDAERTRDQGADVAGAVFFWIFAWVRALIGMLIFALLVVLAARPLVEGAAHEAWVGRPLLSLGVGAALAALAVPVAGMVFVMGLFVGGWWIAFVWLVVVWLVALFGLVAVALALGRWIVRALAHRGAHPMLGATLGILLLSVVGAVPFIGWLVYVIAVLVGMGAVVLALYSSRTDSGAPRLARCPPPRPRFRRRRPLTRPMYRQHRPLSEISW